MRKLVLTILVLLVIGSGFIFTGCQSGLSSKAYLDGLDAYNRKDYKETFRLWLPLAEQGLADAQYNLGLMYLKGEGVPQDFKEGLKWFRLAAEQGDINAKKKLKELESQTKLAEGNEVSEGVSKAIEKMLEKIKRKMAENELAEFKNIQKGGMTCTYHSSYTGEMKYQWSYSQDAKGFKVFMNGALLNGTTGLKILKKESEIAVDMRFLDGGKFYLDIVKTQSTHDSIGLSYQGDCQKP